METLSFDQFCRVHRVTKGERWHLVNHLAGMRAASTIRALQAHHRPSRKDADRLAFYESKGRAAAEAAQGGEHGQA